MNYKTIVFDSWPRAEHFKFYSNAAQPWFNICCNIDVSTLYNHCQHQGYSFFHAYLYLTQQAINCNESFKYRIVGDEVRIYNDIAVSIAVLAEDEMMRFCDLTYVTTFREFTLMANIQEQKVKSQAFIADNFSGKNLQQNVIHMSVLPWFSFTSFSNARNTECINSIPKVIFGKWFMQNDNRLMPLSVEVHHGVMDGLHVGRFVDTLQNMFNAPELLDN